jgi:peptide/nickel transport system ATP-binding protein
MLDAPAFPPDAPPDPLIEVRNLSVVLPLIEGDLRASDDVSFSIGAGRTMGLVGESGCGKTMTAQSILKITPKIARTSGQILLHRPGSPPVDIVALDRGDPVLSRIRGGEVSMIFQEPMTSFSPVHTIGNQLLEAIYLHRTRNRAEAEEIAISMLDRVGIMGGRKALQRYPHHLSGGMRQRAMIAMALASEPRLLIADEPTTALDVTVQAQVLRLMKGLQQDLGMAILYISHDLGVIARMADEVAVMYLGSIVEQASVRDLFRAPRHPYTRGLLASMPKLGRRTGKPLDAIQGNVPIPINKPNACSFMPRCPDARRGLCDLGVPRLTEAARGHRVACFLAGSPAVGAAANGGGHAG